MTKPAMVSDDPLIMKVRRALKAIEPRKLPTDVAQNKYGHVCWVCPYCGDLILRKERWNSYRFSPTEKWNWGNYNSHFTAKHGTPFWKERLLIEIIGADFDAKNQPKQIQEWSEVKPS